MFCYEKLSLDSQLNRQKLIFIPLLLIGCFIYVYLLYLYVWQTEPLKHDLYVSSAYNLLSEQNKSYTTRIIALATNTLTLEPLFCKNEKGQSNKAILVEMGGPKQCAIWNYFIDCEFEEPAKKLTLFGATSDTLEVNVRSPSPKNQKLVVCFSRIIETYRKYGVELFSIPIISVIKELFIILKHYESHGIVSLRNGVVLPKIPNLSYNPNFESEFFNQVISSTECLYEYKQTAEFILFADLDDLVIPKNYATLYEEVFSLSKAFPLASSFEFQWARFNLDSESDPEKFNIEETIKGVEFKELVNVGKTIAIAKRLKSGIIHRPYTERYIDGNYKHKILDSNTTLTIHLRRQLDELKNHSDNAYFRLHNFNGMTKNLHKFLALNETVYQAFKSLPQQQTYFPLMVRCYLAIGKQLKKGTLQTCPNPLICKPDPGTIKECVVLESTYESSYIGNRLTIHKSSAAKLVESQNCLVSEINT